MIAVARTTEDAVAMRVGDGPVIRVDWDTLRRAATQEDPELREVYGAALKTATRMREAQIQRGIDAAKTLIVRYGHDSSGVWYHAWVETEDGQYVGRTWRTMAIVAADEGGTLAHEWMARDDAECIAARIRKIRGASARVVAS